MPSHSLLAAVSVLNPRIDLGQRQREGTHAVARHSYRCLRATDAVVDKEHISVVTAGGMGDERICFRLVLDAGTSFSPRNVVGATI